MGICKIILIRKTFPINKIIGKKNLNLTFNAEDFCSSRPGVKAIPTGMGIWTKGYWCTGMSLRTVNDCHHSFHWENGHTPLYSMKMTLHPGKSTSLSKPCFSQAFASCSLFMEYSAQTSDFIQNLGLRRKLLFPKISSHLRAN